MYNYCLAEGKGLDIKNELTLYKEKTFNKNRIL